MHRTRDRNKLTPAWWIMVGLFAIHTCTIAAVNLGLELTRTQEGLWIYGICIPMVVAWVKVQIEVITRTY
jgi:hypothetical protein